jgi:hypothetical protein
MVNLLHQGHISQGLEMQLMNWMNDSLDKYEFTFFEPSDRPISNNRNKIVKKFLAGDWDILFMLDDDNPPLKNPFDLIEFDKDVIGGIYPGRDDMGIHFHAYMFSPNFPNKIEFIQCPVDKREGLQQIDALATGCMFVKRRVLEVVKSPFSDMFDEDGILITNDDMAFSIRCKKAGFEVWTHWDHLCSHYKTMDLLQMLGLMAKSKAEGYQLGFKDGRKNNRSVQS